MQPLVSIIIPVYNVENYLDQCLDSVEAQSFANWECILVDDGSTDAGGEKCDEWAERDSRFKVLHQENKGVSEARNRGIDEAKGDFITFIDSDDWVDEHYLEALMNGGVTSSIDMVVSGATHVSSNNTHAVYKPLNEHLVELNDSTPATVRSFLDNIGHIYAPTAILYSRFIIESNGIRFPLDRSLGEDIIFNFTYLSFARKILFIPESHYYYRVRQGSLVSACYSNRFDIHYSNWLYQKSFLKSIDYWNVNAEEEFASKLWGIVYESLFMSEDRSLKMVKRIISIEEIGLLRKYEKGFVSASWIKKTILSRNSLLVWSVANLLKLTK